MKTWITKYNWISVIYLNLTNKIVILLLLMTFYSANSKVQQMRNWQLNRCVFSCFLKTPTVIIVRRSQFSRQTVPNYRAVYSKATTTVNCPSTWHNELACCRGSQVGMSSLSRDRCAVWCQIWRSRAMKTLVYQYGRLELDLLPYW